MYYLLLGIIVYALFLSLITKKKFRLLNDISFIMIITILTFVIGLRYDVGIDYTNYETNFNFRYNEFQYEILYSILSYVIKVVFGKFHYLTFIMILISHIFIYLGVRKRKLKNEYLILTLIIYLSSLAPFFMNGMRQGVAIAVFFYCSTFIQERKLKKFLVYMLIGAGFHSSILLLLPMYFLPNIKIPKRLFFMFIIISYVVVYFGISQDIINFIAYRIPMYSYYYNHRFLFNENVDVFSMGLLLKVLFAIFIILFSKKIYKDYCLEKNYYMIGIVFNILSLSTFMYNRIGHYFAAFSIFAIPKLIEEIEKKRLRIPFFIFSFIVFIALIIQTFIINPEASNLQYKSIFSIMR